MCLIQILQDKYTKFRTQTRVARVWRLWAYATRIWLYTVYIVYLCIWLYTVRNSLNPYLERSDLVEVLQWACTWAYRSAQLVVPVIRWKATFAGELFLCLSWCMGTLLLSVVARSPRFQPVLLSCGANHMDWFLSPLWTPETLFHSAMCS